MEQQDAHLRVRQTAAARVIGRAWQHVRVDIQVSGTACLALRRFDKAAVDEKKAMYTKFARVGQIMLGRHRALRRARGRAPGAGARGRARRRRDDRPAHARPRARAPRGGAARRPLLVPARRGGVVGAPRRPKKTKTQE